VRKTGEDEFQEYYDLAFGMRPAEELFDLRSDPEQINNVAGLGEYANIKIDLSTRLQEYTARTGDPRALGEKAQWDFYPYYGRRENKNWFVDVNPK